MSYCLLALDIQWLFNSSSCPVAMRSPAFVVLASLAVLGATSPVARSSHVVHEKRSAPPSGWQARDRVEGHIKVPLKIGLKQRNLDMGAHYLDEVSRPGSAKYGQHWTPKEIVEMFSPRSVPHIQ